MYLFVRGMCGPQTPVVDGDPCGTLLLNQQGVRGAGGVLNNRAQLTLDCWNR